MKAMMRNKFGLRKGVSQVLVECKSGSDTPELSYGMICKGIVYLAYCGEAFGREYMCIDTPAAGPVYYYNADRFREDFRILSETEASVARVGEPLPTVERLPIQADKMRERTRKAVQEAAEANKYIIPQIVWDKMLALDPLETSIDVSLEDLGIKGPAIKASDLDDHPLTDNVCAAFWKLGYLVAYSLDPAGKIVGLTVIWDQ